METRTVAYAVAAILTAVATAGVAVVTLQRHSLLVRVSRVPGWCFGPILYTIGVIHSRTIPKTLPDTLGTLILLLSLSFPLCIIVFGVNDVYDYESDLRNPRKQGESLEGGVLSPVHHAFVLSSARKASLIILLASIAKASSIPPPSPSSSQSRLTPERLQPSLITFFIISLGWAYSAPPIRLKERPLIDSLSNGCMVWLCWALGYVSGGNRLPIFSFMFPEGSTGIGEGASKGWLLALCTSGVHAMGAVADVGADTTAGQTTIATAFGERLAATFSVFCYLVAFTTAEPHSIVALYTLVGASIAFSPAIRPTPAVAHGAFQAIVYASVGFAVGWIGERMIGILAKMTTTTVPRKG